jgi:predicted nuclease of predicted toxin-antitoxin system
VIRLLLDEAVSRSVAHRLRSLGIDAIHIGERGLANSRFPDYAVWRRAVEESRILVTINVRDFVALAKREEIHAGLITFPSGAASAE